MKIKAPVDLASDEGLFLINSPLLCPQIVEWASMPLQSSFFFVIQSCNGGRDLMIYHWVRIPHLNKFILGVVFQHEFCKHVSVHITEML